MNLLGYESSERPVVCFVHLHCTDSRRLRFLIKPVFHTGQANCKVGHKSDVSKDIMNEDEQHKVDLSKLETKTPSLEIVSVIC